MDGWWGGRGGSGVGWEVGVWDGVTWDVGHGVSLGQLANNNLCLDRERLRDR